MTAYLPSDLCSHDEKRKTTICNRMHEIFSHATAVKYTIVTWVGCMSLLSFRKQCFWRRAELGDDSAAYSF